MVSQARLEPSARVLIPPKEMGIKKTLSGFCFIFNCGEGGITNVVSQARLEPSARVLIPPRKICCIKKSPWRAVFYVLKR